MRRALCLVLLVGCGDDGGSVQKDAAAGDGMMIDGQLVDAPRPVHAGIDAQQFVLSVTCPGGTLPTITSTDGELFYTPNSVTIAQNDIVKFVTSATHDVVPNTTNSDPGLRVGPTWRPRSFGASTRSTSPRPSRSETSCANWSRTTPG